MSFIKGLNMLRSFSINFNTLSIPQPIGGKEIFSEGLLGLNILCCILADMGYRITPLEQLGDRVDQRYIDVLTQLIIPEVTGIPTGAAADVIPISYSSYLVQLTY